MFFIPKWRLEAQKLIRQKSLTLKRMKALHEIVAENDGMKEDAELVTLKYEKKLAELGEGEKAVTDKLAARLAELDAETKQIKAVLFDAKLQFRSNEMKEETYQQIKMNTDELVEHITNEKTEIGNVRAKLSGLTIDNVANEAPAQTEAPKPAEAAPAEAAPAASAPAEEKPVAVAVNAAAQDAAWLNQVIQQ
ncbi:CdvA-like protein [Candidatus Nitrososphaera sp. FF02]|uniref:CdvA-like protein n=1 Tax=Candidatus Nitrososphaera sp. FF02 TaxID=3398226 RepID=UPI0039ED6B95